MNENCIWLEGASIDKLQCIKVGRGNIEYVASLSEFESIRNNLWFSLTSRRLCLPLLVTIINLTFVSFLCHNVCVVAVEVMLSKVFGSQKTIK